MFEATRARHAARKEARDIAASVRPGDTIYVTDTHHLPDGARPLAIAYTVGRGGRVGSSTVEGLVLRSGLVSRSRPRGVQTLAEYTAAQNVDAPDHGIDWPQESRPKTGARR